jgi:hypothetical protein
MSGEGRWRDRCVLGDSRFPGSGTMATKGVFQKRQSPEGETSVPAAAVLWVWLDSLLLVLADN